MALEERGGNYPMTETEGRVRRALDGQQDVIRLRAFPVDDIHIRKDGDGRTVTAYAAVFGIPTPITDQDGQYQEQIARNAFDKTLGERRRSITLLYNHGRTLHGTPSDEYSVPIGRIDSIKPDARGLLTESHYNKTPAAERVLESIRHGDPMGMSFTGAFLVSDPQPPYRARSDGSLQAVTRKEIALFELGPTPAPAYPEAAVLGWRAAQAREAARAAANGDGTAARPDGAEAYRRRPGEDVQCPDCGAYNEADANYCDQCGDQLPDSAFPSGRQGYQKMAGETVQCPACGRYNEPDAVYCDQCGAALPESAYEGSPAPPGGMDAMEGAEDEETPGSRAASTARHEPLTGTHSHAHPAYGSQGGDATHAHEHTHNGDANHAHSHAAPDDDTDSGTGDDMGMRSHADDSTRERALTAAEKAKFTSDIADSSKNPVHDLSAAVRRLSQYAGSGNYPKNVTYADLKWMYNQICAELKKRDPESMAGGNFPPQHRADDTAMAGDTAGATAQDAGEDDDGERCQAMQDAFASAGSRSADVTPDPGRSQTTPAASGTGAVQRTIPGRTAPPAPPAPPAGPHEHPAETSSTGPQPHPDGHEDKEGKHVETTMTVADRAARQEAIRERMTALDTAHDGTVFPQEAQAEWDALSAEYDDHERAITEYSRAREVRRERLAALAQRQAGERVATQPDSAPPANQGGEGGSPSTRTAPAFVPTRSEDDIYDLGVIRQRSRSPEEAVLGYRDNAMRAIERAIFPGSESRERAQATVERLLHRVDGEDGFLAKRILATGSPLYMRAWSKAVARLSRDALTTEESRALSLGTGADGGFAVPFELDPTVILTSNGTINPLRQISRIQQITGKEYDLVTSAGVTVSRSAEASAVSDNAPTLAQPTIKAERVTGFIPFSVEIEQDWQALQSEMMMLLADAKDIEEATSFTLGDGTGTNAGGVITTLSTASVVTGATTATLAASDLYTLEDDMAPRFRPRASWMASKTTFNAYRQLFTQTASAAGDPWVRPSQGTPAELLGYPAYEASDMVTTHASGDKVIILGDFGRGFIIIDRLGMSVEMIPTLFDQATARPTGQRGLLAIWRNNSRVLVDNAFRCLKVL